MSWDVGKQLGPKTWRGTGDTPPKQHEPVAHVAQPVSAACSLHTHDGLRVTGSGLLEKRPKTWRGTGDTPPKQHEPVAHVAQPIEEGKAHQSVKTCGPQAWISHRFASSGE